MAAPASIPPPTPPDREVVRKSSFDDHNPPAQKLIDECVHCGFCLPTCPTYALWREEMDSPRGRIYLMKMASEGKVEINHTFVRHLDQCLSCMACMTACPSGVQYDKIVTATRAQIERHYHRPWTERLKRQMIFSIFPRPRLLRGLLLPLWLYQRSGLRWLAYRSGLMKLLPKSMQGMEELLPRVSLRTLGESLPASVSAVGPVRARVGLLVGCVQSVIFPGVNAATARVLAAEGCEVVIPQEQGCCGALMTHAGEEKHSLESARRLIDVFERANVQTVIVNAAGCGSNLKDYGHLLRDDPAYADRAREFAARCKDICEFLAGLEPRAKRHPLSLRVAYHDACHIQHAQRVQVQPRSLLQTIPQVSVNEIPESALCCGSAGIYNLVEPDTAKQLGERKARNAASTKPDVIATGNPGCMLQLRSALERLGESLPVVHPVEILDSSIRGGGNPFLPSHGRGPDA
ncbi:MAG TPA: heterodisulfide reductase-related iron-sulfur binding cluster [Terriglobales bacterium]|nr:heterodisulfide reductase-related iron-sulfur binding cluster [Terriglobales bacterium]